MIEASRVRIDLETLDGSYPAKTRTEVMPDGSEHKSSVWDRERLLSLLHSLDGASWADREVVYTGLPPCWAIAAVDHKTNPRKSYHATHYLGGAEMEMRPLPLGRENPESEIRIETMEDGDKLYMLIIADDPAVGYHYYDPLKLEKAVAPPIPEGKHLYLIADAATFILLCYEKTYAPLCKSVSVSFFHDRVGGDMRGQRIFTCCYTACDEVRPGDRELVPPRLDTKKPIK